MSYHSGDLKRFTLEREIVCCVHSVAKIQFDVTPFDTVELNCFFRTSILLFCEVTPGPVGIVTANEFGKGNVFTGICHSVGGLLTMHWDMGNPQYQTWDPLHPLIPDMGPPPSPPIPDRVPHPLLLTYGGYHWRLETYPLLWTSGGHH